MYLPGFPAIAKDLATSVSKVSLSLSGFFIGISLGQLLYGPLLDRFGRKKPLYIGLSVYILASIGCALSHTIGALIFTIYPGTRQLRSHCCVCNICQDLFL
jgi:DHA1 family bicyclomycin/chloramphenicol resistance-like MFS transporter